MKGFLLYDPFLKKAFEAIGAKEETSFDVPKNVQAAAQRALDWISKDLAGSGFTDVGRARASQLARGGPVSKKTIKRMNSYFSRHEPDKKAEGFYSGQEGYPSPGRVAWDSWGGDAGKSWARKMVRKWKD
jgi:hypothetical protein